MNDEKKSLGPSESNTDLEPTYSLGVGVVKNHGDLHRSFTPRQIHVIALGSNVGSGLCIGTGKAFANGGPANMILPYSTVCIAIWAHLQTFAEMTIVSPTSGSYIDYADRWVDPALAFGAGLAEWLGWTAVFASEATFFAFLVDYWTKDVIPEAALLGGAGLTGSVKDGSTWTDLPAFKMASKALLVQLFLPSGPSVIISILAYWVEEHGRRAIHGTCGQCGSLARDCLLYGLDYLCLCDCAIIRSQTARWLWLAASPFVIAIDNAGIKVAPDLVNACMIIRIVVIALECIFLTSRMLRTMALQKLIPSFIAEVDKRADPAGRS
ncbi:hypothetical protein AN4604.2 [Aspergillus nidulans FGSC A4]|uniref:Amino acid transporter (Eurofung) n=1 Tax=Emericella nidulans (strain FGSC A4 / ATCC 38163 / CBS 112.46 / NRRL 194 / M139) TaxID=227321 RepID=Q5B4C6_EMENI|nr:hypothetical protein [Aspergillus nidulans FGSC A4]EAA60406.1 hypothetical protein AN4604.2 [Aspergillus nidulans FGSC A4]CBF77165.1 TPA: amino acid transporter (Eurofung) [Aspergillus nidulans FGSC A4]|eukprot:XP_662208.1 hypothetical protein AN4604.2 [Aspergillus nidulans FGSC A4]